MTEYECVDCGTFFTKNFPHYNLDTVTCDDCEMMEKTACECCGQVLIEGTDSAYLHATGDLCEKCYLDATNNMKEETMARYCDRCSRSVPVSEGTLYAIEANRYCVDCYNATKEASRELACPYAEKGIEIGKLVESKQKQYGNSAGSAAKIFKIYYPHGIEPHQYEDALLMVRVLDKLSRIAQRGEDGKDLGGESPWKDIAGYGLLGWQKDESKSG